MHSPHQHVVLYSCLNRYYVAEGVRLYNQETWSRVLGNTGREVVAQYIKEVVNYYTLQSEAENHAVREVSDFFFHLLVPVHFFLFARKGGNPLWRSLEVL